MMNPIGEKFDPNFHEALFEQVCNKYLPCSPISHFIYYLTVDRDVVL